MVAANIEPRTLNSSAIWPYLVGVDMPPDSKWLSRDYAQSH